VRQPAPVPIPRDQRLAHFRQARLPVAVWALAIVASVSLLALRATQTEVIGVAEPPGLAQASRESHEATMAEARTDLISVSSDAAYDEHLHAAVPAVQGELMRGELPAEEEPGSELVPTAEPVADSQR